MKSIPYCIAIAIEKEFIHQNWADKLHDVPVDQLREKIEEYLYALKDEMEREMTEFGGEYFLQQRDEMALAKFLKRNVVRLSTCDMDMLINMARMMIRSYNARGPEPVLMLEDGTDVYLLHMYL